MSLPRRSYVPQIALFLAISLNACKKDSATITFDQVGACNGYQQTVGGGPIQTISAGAGQAYVVFHFTSINNTKSSIAFNFDPAKIYVMGTNPKANIDPSLGFTKDLGVFTVVPVTVSPSQTRPLNGLAVAVVAVAGGASEANKISYSLGYDAGTSDPDVFFAKSNQGQTSWPQTDNCRAMQLKL